MAFPNSIHILYGLLILFAVARLTTQQYDGFVNEVSHHFDEKLSYQLNRQVMFYHNLELAYRAYAAYFDRADVDLPGFKKLFRQLEGQALKNAVTLTTYINERGGRVRFPETKLDAACNYINTFNEKNTDAASAKPYICCFQSTNDAPCSNTKKTDKSYVWRDWFSKNSNDNSEDTKEYNWKSKAGLHGLEDALTLEKYINGELLGILKLARDPHAKVTIDAFMEHQVDTIQEVADLIAKLRQYLQGEDYPLGEYLLDQELVK
jgi:ferritin